MEIHVQPTKLDGVVVVETDFVRDARGFFIELYHQQTYAAHGLTQPFVQDNLSRSARHVLRGIHYQDLTAPQAKLVRCLAGAILDVAVDLRADSPTFGQWVAVELTAEDMKQLLVPVGFGHAFVVLSDTADVLYKCTGYYAPQAEGAIAWNDPDLAIEWPVAAPLLSQRDQQAMSLRDYCRAPAFR